MARVYVCPWCMTAEVRYAVLRGLRAGLGERGLVMINKASAHHAGEPSDLYAAAVVEIAKVAIQRYSKLRNIPRIGNVELLMDRTGINIATACQTALARAQRDDGRFRAVSHIAAVDSCAVPFLQVADLTAYARRWSSNGEINAARLPTFCDVV